MTPSTGSDIQRINWLRAGIALGVIQVLILIALLATPEPIPLSEHRFYGRDIPFSFQVPKGYRARQLDRSDTIRIQRFGFDGPPPYIWGWSFKVADADAPTRPAADEYKKHIRSGELDIYIFGPWETSEPEKLNLVASALVFGSEWGLSFGVKAYPGQTVDAARLLEAILLTIEIEEDAQ